MPAPCCASRMRRSLGHRPADALTEIRRQYAAWRGAPCAAGDCCRCRRRAQSGRLHLVTPSEQATQRRRPSRTRSGAARQRYQKLGCTNSRRSCRNRGACWSCSNAELAKLQARLAREAQPPPRRRRAPTAATPPPAATPAARRLRRPTAANGRAPAARLRRRHRAASRLRPRRLRQPTSTPRAPSLAVQPCCTTGGSPR